MKARHLVICCLVSNPAAQISVSLSAAPGTVQLAPGVSANAWLYNGSLPGPVLRVTEGQTLRVRFHNDLPEATAIHWHGQPVQLGMDGVPGMSRPAIAPGQEFTYELGNLKRGTYWYHPHGHETQLDVGLAGVLIIDPAKPLDDPPFDVDQVVVLDDWNNTLGGTFTGHVLNGRSSQGQTPILVQQGQRLRLRFLNASAVSNYVVALDGHPLTVTHADGHRVQPVSVGAIPIGIGERYDAIVDCNNPGVWSLAASAIDNRSITLVRGIVQYVGQSQAPPSAGYVPPNLATGTLLDYAQLAAFFAVPSITATPNRTYTANLTMSMGPGGMIHTINGQAWPNVTPFQVAAGDQVQFAIVNQGMPGMAEYHPMHIHGHFFRLMNTAGGNAHPPLKDTVLIRPTGAGSTATMQILMDNPGRWLLHCHNMEHMASGMMTAFEYVGDADGDGLADRSDYEPLADAPVVMIPDQAAMFAPGSTGQVSVQWTPGQLTSLFMGLGELTVPVAMPPYGALVLDPAGAWYFGSAMTDPAGLASLPYAIPANTALRGLRVGLQGLAATALSGGLRLSTFQALTVR